MIKYLSAKLYLFIFQSVAVIGVPLLLARPPGQLWRHPREEVEERPGADDHVVDVDAGADEDHAVAEALEDGGNAGEQLEVFRLWRRVCVIVVRTVYRYSQKNSR